LHLLPAHYNYYRDAFDPAIGRFAQSDPIGLFGGLNTYAYVASDPTGLADPLGLDAIGVVFPDYNVATPIGRQQWGHAGVVVIDPSGRTKYYEYGRYRDNNCQCGSVRSLPVPDVSIGQDGHPTSQSLNRLLAAVSRQSGQGGRVSGAYVPNGNSSAMNDYARRRMDQNGDPNRKPYGLLTNNCSTFMLDVLKAGGVDTPWFVDTRPNNVMTGLRNGFPGVDYSPAGH